ncbi:MAG: hypothetical protein H6742_13515 [Alphaproteobacteria bacterium]|nr:hypothetical protein [Alphaproteobacteria bacterium]
MSDLTQALHYLLQAVFALLYVGVIVGCLATLGKHRKASLLGLAGSSVLLVSQLTVAFSYWAIGWAQGAGHIELGDFRVLGIVYGLVGMFDTLAHVIGIVLLGLAAHNGRQSWYEAELATPLPGGRR